MDNEEYDENNYSVNSLSSSAVETPGNTGLSTTDSYLNYEFGYPFNFANSLPKNLESNISSGPKRPKSTFCAKPKKLEIAKPTNIEPKHIQNAPEPYAHINLETLMKLKDSTRKLICLLEEIQCKTHSKTFNSSENRLTELIQPISSTNTLPSVTDIIGAAALKKLENQAKTLDDIYIEEEDDDCSIYKRLTRKCHCLNQQEYNDFTIHFNENTRYFTSNTGEIIKNMRILKKFLYMGGDYGKHALMFLNEGLSDSTHSEKVEITQGCSHADMCNIFEDHSIVIICISWPCKYENYGNAHTQALTAGFLYKLAQLEEGRRYLKYSSKITNDLKKVIRKKAAKLELDTLESLNATLNLMHPPLAQHLNVTYYCKPADEGFGNKTVRALVQYREYMTTDEIFTHLDLLHSLSNNDNGQQELASFLPALLSLFKNLLVEYDNSEMNIIITNILNNLVTKSMLKPNDLPKTVVMADTATEPIVMKNETVQIPPKKNNSKKNKSKLGLGIGVGVPQNKFRTPSKKKVSDWTPPVNTLNRSRKFSKDARSAVIVVPIEE